jgi:transposase-like protein
MSGKIMFKDLFDNVGSRMPKNLHDGFVSSVMNATVQGRKMIREEVDRNQIFYTDSIRHILDEFDRKYLDQIPDPLEPSTIDTFLEQKMDFLKLSRDRINEEFQRTLRLK